MLCSAELLTKDEVEMGFFKLSAVLSVTPSHETPSHETIFSKPRTDPRSDGIA
jgi:hypothetical protein